VLGVCRGLTRFRRPGGELAAPGVVMTHLHDAGFEVIHGEDLRQHYALTLEHWCRNLQHRDGFVS